MMSVSAGPIDQPDLLQTELTAMANRPARWTYRCHIIDHHAAGMMGHFEVVAAE